MEIQIIVFNARELHRKIIDSAYFLFNLGIEGLFDNLIIDLIVRFD